MRTTVINVIFKLLPFGKIWKPSCDIVTSLAKNTNLRILVNEYVVNFLTCITEFLLIYPLLVMTNEQSIWLKHFVFSGRRQRNNQSVSSTCSKPSIYSSMGQIDGPCRNSM